ncbi:hypothetical protein D9M70_653190 [compost metagenome]
MANGQRQLQKGGAVFHEQRDHVADTDTMRDQKRSRPFHARLQQRIAQALIPVDQREAPGFRARPPGDTRTH